MDFILSKLVAEIEALPYRQGRKLEDEVERILQECGFVNMRTYENEKVLQ